MLIMLILFSQTLCLEAFQNCGPLPLVFADALFTGSLLSDVTSCISFYLLAWSPLFWSAGRMIIGTYDNGDNDNDNNKPYLAKRAVEEVKKFLSPPVLGAITGLFVGGVPFLRDIFFDGIGSPMFGALKTLGMAYLPSALLVLAGSLVASTSKPKPVNGEEIQSPSAGPSLKAIVAILASRFAITPLLAIFFVKLYGGLGLLGTPGTQAFAVASFCLLMEGCMPPAQNSVLLYSLAGLTERASTMAKLLAIMYGLAIVPVTILISTCLSLSGISVFR
jgi:auxin efflux carrier family protein